MAASNSRGHNFTVAEKEAALSCIELNRAVLECKKTDTVSSKMKELAWENVASQYNALPYVLKRTAKQLRLWWDNQKKRARSRLADHKVL
jgi:Myb/SANT-like DNA-binding domain